MRKIAFVWCALLLCTGLALAGGPPSGQQVDRAHAVSPPPPPTGPVADRLSDVLGNSPGDGNGGPADGKEKDGYDPDAAKRALEKPVPEPDGPVTVVPLDEFGDTGLDRGACVGDKLIGSGTATWDQPFKVYYQDSRTTSLYLASEFGCDGGQINGIKYYIYRMPTGGYMMNNLTIRLKHTTLTALSSTTFDNADWTVCYQANTQITATGWYTFTFTTPFVYDSLGGTQNLLVDVSFNNSAYASTSYYVYRFAGTGNRSLYKYCDDCTCGTSTDPLLWTTCSGCTLTTYIPQAQFIFPPPDTGACCVDYVCVATNTSAECAALGGSWFGGETCPGFYCPPWNDNCTAVTPTPLTANVPVTFTGNNLGATNDCGLFAGGQVWHAFTLPTTSSFFDVYLDYCTTAPAFGNAWLNMAVGCPCSSATTAGTYDYTTCGDGNITIRWSGMTGGATYYYPVLLDPAHSAAGPYTIHVVARPAYCASYATSTADETIKNVTLNTINNTTTNCDTYDDFTAISTTLRRGSTYPLSLTIGDCEGTSCYSKRAAIYIDWNQDFTFATGERAYYSGQLSNTPCPDMTVEGYVTVPVDAALGCTRMRVIVVETSSTDPAPCGSYTWGATEDYTVCIEPALPTGACCFGMTCEDTGTWNEPDCVAAGGRYMGDGSTCTPNPCFGACCRLDGSCVETQTLADCQAAGGNFQGTGTTCATTNCPQPGVECSNPVVVTLSLATLPYVELGGTNCGYINNYDYSSTTHCLYYYDSGEDKLYKLVVTEPMDVTITLDPKTTTYAGIAIGYSCPPMDNCIAAAYSSSATPKIIGALPNCLHLEAGEYYIMVDTWASPTCIPVYDLKIEHCVVPTGACCVGESCSVITAAACTAAGGLYMGDWTNCDPNPCMNRACCLPNGTCQDMSEGNCAAAGGTWHGTALCANILCNDNCADAISVATGTPAATGDNCAATDDGSATCQTNSHKDVWYKWVASCTGTVTMDTEGSTQSDTVLSVYTACGGTQIACDDDGGTGLLSMLSFNCTAGVEYVIRVASYSTGCGGFKLNIACVAAPQGACCMPDGTCHLDYQTTCTGVFGGVNTQCAAADCNNNGIDDFCDIKAGTSHDCQPNGIPDECDIAAGTSLDVDHNGVPDECDPDCNDNGIPDACELPGGCATGDCGTVYPDACGTGEDCQPDGVLDECQLGGKGRICEQMVYDAGDCDGVNGTSPSAGWANNGIVDKFTVPQAGGPLTFQCLHVVILGGSAYTPPPSLRLRVYALPTGSIVNDLPSFAAATPIFDHTYTSASGELVITTHATCYPGAPAYNFDVSGPAYTLTAGSYGLFVNFPGYTTSSAVYWASAADEGMGYGYIWGTNVDAPYNASMALAWNLKGGGGGGGGGADCNDNGVPDDCDIQYGTSQDCQPNGIPDECEVPPIGTGPDCNNNGIPDACELLDNDCNNNGIPDDCDIANGTSQDCQPDGIPDECQLGQAPELIKEGFENITNLPGWYMQNNSSPLGTTNWFQGNTSVFTAQAGSAASYIGANFNNVYLQGTISNWLLTPKVRLVNGQQLSFYTRTSSTSTWADRLQVRMSLAGASTNVGTTATSVGDFTTLLLDINPTYVSTGYPHSWDDGHYTVTITGVPTPTDGRLAFRYFVENGGYYGTNSNYIGIDTVNLGSGLPPENDCNQNGVPDECDIASGFSHDYNGDGIPDECQLCGDLDHNGTVGMSDYWLFVNAFGACSGDPKYNAEADFDGDGCVTLVDYQHWVLCYRMANGKNFVVPPKVNVKGGTQPVRPGSAPKGDSPTPAPLP